jgi:hypothetical protein
MTPTGSRSPRLDPTGMSLLHSYPSISWHIAQGLAVASDERPIAEEFDPPNLIARGELSASRSVNRSALADQLWADQDVRGLQGNRGRCTRCLQYRLPDAYREVVAGKLTRGHLHDAERGLANLRHPALNIPSCR